MLVCTSNSDTQDAFSGDGDQAGLSGERPTVVETSTNLPARLRECGIKDRGAPAAAAPATG